MPPPRRWLVVSVLTALAALAVDAHAAGWLEGEDASGDWGGARRWLDERGLHIDLDYTGESFALPADGVLSYRGNLDLVATLDTAELGLWPCGSWFVYGQHAHGHGVSDELVPLTPVSNLEAPAFTQLSELWLEQCLGEHVRLRLGKQDANRDFASPRFAGNFVNSSYGVIPTAPMPSFPAPGVGAALLVDATGWLGLRAGVYEGAPTIHSFGEDAFADGAGLFAVAQLVLSHDLFGQPAGRHSIGAWTHTGQDRRGVFAVLDWQLPAQDTRSVQLFVRGGWSERAAGQAHLYAGGGVTAHGFLGANNTVGAGAGQVRVDDTHESFVELFFKLRPLVWLSFEPDAQLYLRPGGMRGERFVVGLRVKLKL